MTTSDGLAVLILAAGSAKEKIPGLPLSQDCLAFLPVNSQPLARLVTNFYQEHGVTDVYIACDEQDAYALRQEMQIYGDSVHILPIQMTSNVLDTLTLACLQIPYEDLIVHAVTTIPTVFLEQSGSVFLEDCQTHFENWSAVVPDEYPQTQFYGKRDVHAPEVKAHAFTGVFRCHKSLILEVCPYIQGSDRQDLVKLIETSYQNTDFKWQKGEWLDCGHVQNFYQTRKKIFGSRYFNSISIEEKTGVLKKTSTNIKKLYAEKSYVESLPEDLKIFFPRIVGYEADEKKADLRMEYYGYPTLAEVMLYWDLPVSLWRSLFERLSGALETFHQHRFPCREEDMMLMYRDKTLNRVQEFGQQKEIVDSGLLTSQTMTINGQTYAGWPKIAHQIQNDSESLIKKIDFSAIHGDFCFNNILGDPFTTIIKLIDPRGSFGASDCQISGDHRYDWAKLGHSIVGCYDYIVNDLFHVEQQSCEEWSLVIPERPWQNDLKNIFWDSVRKAQLEKKEIRWMISMLFLSMTPLHKDRPLRQKAMFLTGLKLYPYQDQ